MLLTGLYTTYRGSHEKENGKLAKVTMGVKGKPWVMCKCNPGEILSLKDRRHWIGLVFGVPTNAV